LAFSAATFAPSSSLASASASLRPRFFSCFSFFFSFFFWSSSLLCCFFFFFSAVACFSSPPCCRAASALIAVRYAVRACLLERGLVSEAS
jgi:hypothetical protein